MNFVTADYFHKYKMYY